jgi:hypothetical protein
MNMGKLGFRFHCGFCSEALDGHGYKLICYEYDDREVTGAYNYRLCNHCHAEIQGVLRHTLVRIRIAKLHETWGHAKQDTAVEIGQQP